MGLFGPLITQSRTDSPRSDPAVAKDYTMTVNDWNHDYDSNIGKSQQNLELVVASVIQVSMSRFQQFLKHTYLQC